MNIGLDIMGGDYAPDAAVTGAIEAHKAVDHNHQFFLIGDEEKGRAICKEHNYDPDAFTWVQSSQVITMGEFPAKAFSKKPDSSISKGYMLLHKGEIDVLASAGNTGAMLVGAMYTIKPVPGVIRPAISAILPRPQGSNGIILDVGLNPDSKPDVLYQYGILGSEYAKHILEIDDPRVAILNIGEEEEKGNAVAQATFEAMQGNSDFNFTGNVEGNALFTPEKADVVVCDGFVGNIVLKEAESFYALMRKESISSDFWEQFNFEKVGGTPILGVNSNVVIGHGISNAQAIKHMLLHSLTMSKAQLPARFKEIFTRWLK